MAIANRNIYIAICDKSQEGLFLEELREELRRRIALGKVLL